MTVPVGLVGAGLEEVMDAETSSDAPAVGVSVAGVTMVVLGLLLTVTVTAAETEDA